MLPENLSQKLETLPERPGCYLFKGREGQVLYVGKATSLRARVRSYFHEHSSDSRAMLPFLLDRVQDLETVVTETEKEATILEDSLIKKYRPRYNVKLRDDKSYLSLRVDPNATYPRVELVRRPSPDGAKYFGPHHSATEARRTLNFINKYFHLRTCSDRELRSRKRPCLQYHIQRCPAPCVLPVDKDDYAANVRNVLLFLEGKHEQVLAGVEQLMREASEKLEFEAAGKYRDLLSAVNNVQQTQRVVTVSKVDQDIIGLHRQDGLAEVTVLFVRAGRMVDARTFSLKKLHVPDEEIISAFLLQYYGEEGAAGNAVPDEVLVAHLPEGVRGMEQWLSDRRGRRVRLLQPKRGAKVALVRMAHDNAEHAFIEKRRAEQDMDMKLAELQSKLRLRRLPRVIECCDISHLGGEDTAGSVVRMVDGELDRSGYRSFHVKTVTGGDDYAAMAEVLTRRFARGKKQREADQEEAEGVEEVADGVSGTGWELPDLFVVDGGRGQLNAALAVARDLGLDDLAIAGLAKERENIAGETLVDRVVLPGQKNGLSVRPGGPLVLLARLRDEAHRVANKVRSKRGKRARFASELDSVPGIGPVLRTRLVEQVGGVDKIRKAQDAELLAVRGVGERQLQALRRVLGREGRVEVGGSDDTPGR